MIYLYRGAEPSPFLEIISLLMQPYCIAFAGEAVSQHVVLVRPPKLFAGEIVTSTAAFPYSFLSSCISFCLIALMFLCMEHLLRTVTGGTPQCPRPGPRPQGAHSLQGGHQTLTQTSQKP